MKIAIIYASQHGTTEHVAQKISSQLDFPEVKLINISQVSKVDLSQYQMIILGSSIHAGNNQRSMQNFCTRNLTILLQKEVALFLCCMREEEADASIQKAYPAVLRAKSLSCKVMGGEYRVDKMNFIEKFLLKKIAHVTESGSFLKQEAIDEFVSDILDRHQKMKEERIENLN